MRGTIIDFPSYRQYGAEQLLTAFQAGPTRMRQVIDGLTEEELRTRARGPGTWSAHEIVIHTTDSEVQGVYRMRKTFSQPGCDLPGYDQDAWAREIDYQSLPASAREAALDLLGELRRTVTPMLRAATPAQWERLANHPEYGQLTLRNLLELYADHTERHVEQILRIRELIGRPRAMPLLLPVRLY